MIKKGIIGFLVLFALAFISYEMTRRTFDVGLSDHELSQNNFEDLKGLPVDAWLDGFFKGSPMTGLDQGKISLEIIRAFRNNLKTDDARWLTQFYNEGPGKFSKNLTTEKDFKSLWVGLIRGAHEVSQMGAERRPQIASMALGLLEQELIYAAKKKIPGLSPVWKLRGSIPASECELHGQELKNFSARTDYCPGEIVVSKGTDFSSFFLQIELPSFALASHTAISFIDPRSRHLTFLESILLGSHFYQPGTDVSVNDRVFRLKRNVREAGQKVGEAIYRFIDPSKNPSWQETGKLFGFNFTLKPQCPSNNFYCSEFLGCLFESSPKLKDENPYPEKSWVPLPEKFAALNLALGFDLGPGPMPIDIQFNPHWELVERTFRVGSIEKARLRYAVFDVMAKLYLSHSPLARNYLASLEKLAGFRSKDLDAWHLWALKNFDLSDAHTIELLKTHLPEDLKISLAVFYFQFQNLFDQIDLQLAKMASVEKWDYLTLSDLRLLVKPMVIRSMVRTTVAARLMAGILQL